MAAVLTIGEGEERKIQKMSRIRRVHAYRQRSAQIAVKQRKHPLHGLDPTLLCGGFYVNVYLMYSLDSFIEYINIIK